MSEAIRPLSVVTGASSGIGYELAQSKKDDPADVAKTGYDAMKKGEGDVVAGWKNKLQAAMGAITPESVKAEQHRKMAEPGSGETYQKPLG